MAKTKPARCLTLADVAFLRDGLQDDLPEGLAGRLSLWVDEDPQFADQIGELEAIATEAGLPRHRKRRLNEAYEIHRDLEQLLEAEEDWQDPAEILDPDGGQGLDLTGLANLAQSTERRRNPPAGIREVHDKLVRALATLAAETAWVDAFVEGLLERPARAGGLLLEAKQEFLARSGSKT